jgi:hypothetical protein
VSATATTTSTRTAGSCCCIAVSAGRLTEPQGCDIDPPPRAVSRCQVATRRSGHGRGPAADRQSLAELIHLGLLWHCLCAITRLEVPERLAAGPLPIPQLAAAVGAHQDALWRVLRLVADHHIVTLEVTGSA